MVKLTVEPVRLTQFLKQSLALGKSSVTEKTLVQFTPEKAVVACNLASDVIILAEYQKKYFKSLECAENEKFTATSSLVKDRLAHGFKGEQVTFSTDKEYVWIKGEGTDDTVKEKLEEINEECIASMNGKLIHYTDTDVGIIPYTNPEKTAFLPFDLQAQIEVARFSDLPEGEHVKFSFDGKNLTMFIEDQLGSRTRPLPILGHAKENKIVEGIAVENKGKPIDVMFNMKLIQQLISQFEGNVWLSFNAGMVAIGQKNPDYSLTYIGAAIS